jgi:hypothetical protein
MAVQRNIEIVPYPKARIMTPNDMFQGHSRIYSSDPTNRAPFVTNARLYRPLRMFQQSWSLRATLIWRCRS